MQSRRNFDALHDISPGKHLYQFFKHAEDFLRLMIPYFQAGLERKEACLWLVSEKIGLDLARNAAASLIPDFSLLADSGQFTITGARDWHGGWSYLDEKQVIENVEHHLKQVQSLGYGRLRSAIDVRVIGQRDLEMYRDYELKISPWIKSHPVIALCAYPILECTPSQTKNVLECHDDVFHGRLVDMCHV